ncbi:hypothetical protein PDESU_00373 [Pontiella desulfatans]|uniref:DUF4268 domain-containing protein n=1 Tax=Pontiella desulfatans TaxID=2750659 RepID=A0A6C2TWZ9_PONDE|nr:DUF4268 domain-containing protein [Pontiella desulfatans]VGO11826.1 hypothetical protein PDESU_00373 [Pontiella desulfatans]
MEPTKPTIEEINELVGFLPRLQEKDFNPIKQWLGGKQPDGTHQIGYPDYHEITEEFFHIASKECWMYPYDPELAGNMINDHAKIKEANMDQIKEMLTFCVRGEHFCDGHWGAMIEDGSIGRLLIRLTELKNTETEPMNNFGALKKVPLRNVWPHEAIDFTPWLADNIAELGDVLGMELELTEREASVGDFSLDLLAKDLSSSKPVIIENQFNQTDHDHLGKLLTYAAGFDASTVIWVSETVRDEHRQALDWLNQRTDSETQFFAVVLEVLQIDESKPAFNFKPVVMPNEWQKSTKRGGTAPSARAELYRDYFQKVIDELRDAYRLTSLKKAQPYNWIGISTGVSGFIYSVSFAQGKNARTEIYMDTGDQDETKRIFDELKVLSEEIEAKYGCPLSWERLDNKRASRIAVYRPGSINDSEEVLSEIRQWHIEHVMKLRDVVVPYLKESLKSIS